MKIRFESEKEVWEMVEAFYKQKNQEKPPAIKKLSQEKTKKREYDRLTITNEVKKDIEDRLAEGEPSKDIAKIYNKNNGWVYDLIRRKVIIDTRKKEEETKTEERTGVEEYETED